jgi:hypothetical protein
MYRCPRLEIRGRSISVKFVKSGARLLDILIPMRMPNHYLAASIAISVAYLILGLWPFNFFTRKNVPWAPDGKGVKLMRCAGYRHQHIRFSSPGLHLFYLSDADIRREPVAQYSDDRPGGRHDQSDDRAGPGIPAEPGLAVDRPGMQDGRRTAGRLGCVGSRKSPLPISQVF